jgi:hypothetical protein
MKRNFSRIGILALIFLGVFVATAQSQTTKPTDELHILFIGNSLTYVNDLPKMVSELAKAGGQRPLVYDRETPGGCTLEKHWKDGKALAKIQARKWDYVVLQEYSTGPLLKRDSMFDYGKKFDAEIKKQGTKTLLYMTWAYQGRLEDQPAISKAYMDLAADLKAEIAPVGNAWEAAILADKKLVLHQNDKKHPTATGTYLAACVFYATVYDKSPEGLPGNIGKLTDEEARPLQVIAWNTVKKTDK